MLPNLINNPMPALAFKQFCCASDLKVVAEPHGLSIDRYHPKVQPYDAKEALDKLTKQGYFVTKIWV